MNSFDKSMEEMHERQEREIAAINKSYRIKKWSLIGFLTAWALYILILPFTSSPSEIIVLLSIFVIFLAQFIYVGLLD